MSGVDVAARGGALAAAALWMVRARARGAWRAGGGEGGAGRGRGEGARRHARGRAALGRVGRVPRVRRARHPRAGRGGPRAPSPPGRLALGLLRGHRRTALGRRRRARLQSLLGGDLADLPRWRLPTPPAQHHSSTTLHRATRR